MCRGRRALRKETHPEGDRLISVQCVCGLLLRWRACVLYRSNWLLLLSLRIIGLNNRCG